MATSSNTQKDNRYSRILFQRGNELLRLCSLHLNLAKDDLYVEFKPKHGHYYQLNSEGSGGVDYRKGSFVQSTEKPSMTGVSHIHYVIPENKALMTYRTSGLVEHTAEAVLPKKKVLRLARIVPHLDDFPIHSKKVGELDLVFSDTRLFQPDVRPVYIDLWISGALGDTDQANFQGVLRQKYVKETGRLSEVIGGRSGANGQYSVMVAAYQPRSAKQLGFTRIILPKEDAGGDLK